MAEAKIRVRKLDPKKATIVVQVDARELKIRAAIGLWLIKLAARIIGLGVAIEAPRWDYLAPKDGPIFDGLESKEVVYAKNQPEYIPLRTLISAGPDRKAISRWTFTEVQRKAVACGADIFLQMLTFGGPLQPVILAIGSGKESPDWVKVHLLDETLPPDTGK